MDKQRKVFPVVMDKDLIKALKEKALQEDRSAASIIRALLEERIRNWKPKDRPDSGS